MNLRVVHCKIKVASLRLTDWFQVADGEGKEAHLILWNHPGVDVTGMVGRCEKVAGSCEKVPTISSV